MTRTTIRNTAIEVFGDGVKVRLFGSRTDDAARGGDIDLLVELPAAAADQRRRSLTFVALLQRRLGDQRIDALVTAPGSPESPIVRSAREHGVPL